MRWFREAAEQGNAGAQLNLGVMYAHGRGVQRNDIHALKWFSLAAAKGISLAATRKRVLEKNMDEQQVEKAESLADAWTVKRDPDTALMHAVTKGQTTVVESLLEAGAQPDVQDALGWTPLIHAAKNGDTGSVRALLKHGADPNAKDRFSGTALMQAAANGHVKTVEFLLANGADPSVTADNGKSALTLAQENGHLSVAERIREHLSNEEMRQR